MKLLLFFLFIFSLGGVCSQLVGMLIDYPRRMRQQKFEALRNRVIGNRYFSKIKVGGRYFDGQ